MILKTAWLKIDPLPEREFQRLCEAIGKDQFTEATTTGFIIDSARKSSMEARFIQKRIFTETILDPFGNESKISQTSYLQTRFTLRNRAPQLLVMNPPRAFSPFITRMGEHCQGKAAIYPPENDTNNLIAALIAQSTAAKITGILISDIQLKGPAVAKVLIKGTEDVKRAVQELVGSRRYSIKEAQLDVITSYGITLNITVKEASRFAIQTTDEEAALDYLRSVMEGLPNK